MKRRTFINQGGKAGAALSLLGMMACKGKEEKPASAEDALGAGEITGAPFFELSLAQWSINRMIRNDGVDPYTFAEKAKQWGFTGLEYVSQLYNKTLQPAGYSAEAMQEFVEKCNAEAARNGLQNVLIMIDGQGNLAVSDEKERIAAVENHYKWVDAAAAMGCHAIRVNLAGSDDPAQWIPNSVDGLTRLGTYASGKGINILVENHGGLSSNGKLMAEVMTRTGMDNCGTLPDFGNFCIRRNDPSNYGAGCAESYDIYQGVSELMPFAKAVSAKAHDFDEAGNEKNIDYARMLQIVKDAGYTGFIGVEYEGNGLGEEAGIIATRNLLLKAAASVS